MNSLGDIATPWWEAEDSGTDRGALAVGWCNRASLLFGSHCSELGHCLRVAALRTAYSGRQQSRFRQHFSINCTGACMLKTACKSMLILWIVEKKKKHAYGIISFDHTCTNKYMSWWHVSKCLTSKIFIYLVETIFIAGSVDEFLVYFLTLPWCLLSPSGLSACPSMRILASIFTVNHTVTLKMTIGVGNVQHCFRQLTGT